MVFGLLDNEKTVRDPSRSTLYLWGCNSQGQTGHRGTLAGATNDHKLRVQREPLPLQAHSLKDKEGHYLCLSDADCGLQHTAVVTVDGGLYTWGLNDHGQLGDGTEIDAPVPKQVKRLRKEFVTAVTCGAYTTACITNSRSPNKDGSSHEGKLWVWGRGSVSNLPKPFHGALPHAVITKVACGASHAAAISREGLLQTWGYNEYGQLGRGFSCEGNQEPRVLRAFVVHMDEAPEPVVVEAVACGEFHTVAVAKGGDVFSWGRGDLGQLGHRSLQLADREVLPRRVVALEGTCVKQVACGQAHTCAVGVKGELYMWGAAHEGQLGLGRRKELFAMSSNEGGVPMQRLPVQVMEKGTELVACGQSHTLVTMRDGRLLGWGYNSCGQAATGRSPYAWEPAQIDWCVGEVSRLAAGGGHSAVITQARSLKELCEFRLAESISLKTAPIIEDIALCNGADSLMRFAVKFREAALKGPEENPDADEERRRLPRPSSKTLSPRPYFTIAHWR